MNGLPYYPRYPRDFFDGTNGMTFDLKGAYSMLLDLIYMSGGQLYDEPRFIAGHLNCSVRAWNGHRAALIELGKITVDNGIISNFRADKELIIQRSFQDKQRKNASGSNKNKDLDKATAQPKHSHTDTDTYKERKIDGDDSAREIAAPMSFRERLLAAMNCDASGITGKGGQWIGVEADMLEARRWIRDLGITPDEVLTVVREVMSKRTQAGPPSTFSYFTKAMTRFAGKKLKAAIPLTPDLAPQTGGRKNERATFDAALNAAINAAPAGSSLVNRARSDPFAKR